MVSRLQDEQVGALDPVDESMLRIDAAGPSFDAVAQALDRYLAGTTRRVGSACQDLDMELDEVLRRLGPPRSSAIGGANV